jgi:flagellin
MGVVMASNFSINTNASALMTLQNLNNTARDLADSQKKVSTGRKVDTPKDNGAVWAISQNETSLSSTLGAVMDSLDRGKSTVDVALAAGANISDYLTQMRAKVLAATDTSLDTTSRVALNEDFKVLRDAIANAVASAEFNGYNIIKSGGVAFQALASADGQKIITVSALNLSLGGGNITITATSTIGTSAAAKGVLTQIATSIAFVNQGLAKMGSQAKQIDRQNIFVSKLRDAIDLGVSNLVDADLAKESARLQALQVKQSLGVQALGIANSNANVLTSLFRGQ